MKKSDENHGVAIGDVWKSKGGSRVATVGDIQVACSGKPLIFYVLDNGEKFICFVEDFFLNYFFYTRNLKEVNEGEVK